MQRGLDESILILKYFWVHIAFKEGTFYRKCGQELCFCIVI